MVFFPFRQWLLNHCSKSSNKRFSTTKDSSRSSLQVCLLGGHTQLGSITSLMLKQNPFIAKLKIQGNKIVDRLSKDLNQIDTKCQIESYSHPKDLRKALRGADIVLLLPNKVWPENTSMVKRILGESQRVYDLVQDCTMLAPRALIVVAVPPVSVFTPFVAQLFKKSNFYNPVRIIGSAALTQAKINSLAGRYLDLDPYICHVPIVGGPDIDLAVPVFSKASPVEIDNSSAMTLMSKFRHIPKDDFPKKHCMQNFIENHDLSEAYALNNMITTLAMGLLGDAEAYYCAFVRSNIIPTCQYLVTMLRFSKEGVAHNLGLPALSSFELDMFERATLEIEKREQMAKELVDFCDRKCKKPPFEIKEQEREQALKQFIIK